MCGEGDVGDPTRSTYRRECQERLKVGLDQTRSADAEPSSSDAAVEEFQSREATRKSRLFKEDHEVV